DSGAGTIKVSESRTAGPITGQGSGSVLTITFHVRPTPPPGGAVVNLRERLTDTLTQLHGTDPANPVNDYYFVLQPAPTDAPTDSVDGLVTVRAVSTTTLTATVNGAFGSPTGTVTFKDGVTPIGTGTLSSGTATYTTSTLAVGSHTVTAVYGSDANYAPSTSGPKTQTVNQDSTTTTLTSSL